MAGNRTYFANINHLHSTPLSKKLKVKLRKTGHDRRIANLIYVSC